jgi:cytochrome c peroxidase
MLVTLLIITGATSLEAQTKTPPQRKIESPNGTGIHRTITTLSSFDQNNPFFKQLGTNGRSCATCHALSEGMNMNPTFAQSLFDLTEGGDPLFAAIDGANSPNGDMSTVEARRTNTTMLRTKGLFRIGLHVPASAEFSVEAVDDPYSYASADEVSAFRRPLPTTNLKFLSSVMWDGRESSSAGTIAAALRSQVKDAVIGHMQATTPPSEADISQIVDFETHLFTSQIYDNAAGSLDTFEVQATPELLSRTPFFPGLNRFIGNNGRHPGFNQHVFALFRAWAPPPPRARRQPTAAQQSIARGERIFTSRAFTISDVPGFTDRLAPPPQRGLRGRFAAPLRVPVRSTCASCHNTPSVGSSSLPFLMNTGISDGARRTADMPLYTFRNNTTGERIQTTDPGAAMTSGKWADIGKFKVPSLRGLETHSPYMHNGFSGELLDIVNFYDSRFAIGLTQQEKDDLVAFLKAL